MNKRRLFFLVGSILSIYLLTSPAFAHEAYVLPAGEFQKGLQINSSDSLAPLFSPKYLLLCAKITIGILTAYLLNFLLSATELSVRTSQVIGKFKNWGFLAVRIALAASFLYGALESSVFGPEISLVGRPEGQAIVWLKVILGILFALGLFTRVAAMVGLAVFFYVSFQVGQYIFTYLTYFGELLALLLFGSRFWALDSLLFKSKDQMERWRDFEVPIVRIFFGLALIYAAVSIKFLHQVIPIEVINLYNLQRFLPGSPEFIAAGAGLSELTIGVFILLGFGQRLTVAVLFIFMTLSLLFFKEAVWPHIILFGLGIFVFINSGDRLTLDRTFKTLRNKISLR